MTPIDCVKKAVWLWDLSGPADIFAQVDSKIDNITVFFLQYKNVFLFFKTYNVYKQKYHKMILSMIQSLSTMIFHELFILKDIQNIFQNKKFVKYNN